MIEFENVIEIEKPVREVFAFVSNFENASKWNYYVLEVKKTTEGPVKVGTTFYQTRKTDNQSFKIVEYEPEKKVSIQTLPDSKPSFEMRFSFEPVKEGTRLIDNWKLDSGKPGLIEKLAKIMVQKAAKENLKKLKKLLETGKVELQDGRLKQI
ncbi:MAG: SRPBCC family protein [candidate division KSB1 bacterium]|nr:SRPBCC family protein [candidate division KSB1 bacterium]